MIDKRGS